jgi:glycosyltransferase involved in cell wall biosynthesis
VGGAAEGGHLRVGINGEPLFQRLPTAVGIYVRALCRGFDEIGQGDDIVLFHALRDEIPEGVAKLPINRRAYSLARDALYQAWAEARRPAPQLVTGPLDVVHAPGPAVPPPGDAALVATIHDLAPLRFPERYERGNRVVHKRGALLAAREADLIICPSYATAEEVEDLLVVERDRIRIVPYGVDVDTLAPDEARDIVARRGIQEPYFLWVGTQEQRKNVESVLDAFVRVSNHDDAVSLVLHGHRGWLGEEVGGGLARRGIAARTFMSEGALSRRDLCALYQRATAFVYPSLYEGFALPVLEAMACGTPVITSNQSALPESAGDAGVLIDPLDDEELAAVMLEMLEGGQRRGELVQLGLERAAAFTWAEAARRTWAVYAEAVARRTGTATA